MYEAGERDPFNDESACEKINESHRVYSSYFQVDPHFYTGTMHFGKKSHVVRGPDV